MLTPIDILGLVRHLVAGGVDWLRQWLLVLGRHLQTLLLMHLPSAAADAPAERCC
jgi:hypothetical protein